MRLTNIQCARVEHVNNFAAMMAELEAGKEITIRYPSSINFSAPVSPIETTPFVFIDEDKPPASPPSDEDLSDSDDMST